MPTTDPTPLEDALRNLGDELSAAGNPQRAAVHALARHSIPGINDDLHRAAIEYATIQDHGRDHPLFDDIVALRAKSPLLRDVVAYTATHRRDEVRQLRDDNARLARQNAAAMRMLRRIVVPAGHPHLVVDLANVRLALGSSSDVADLDDAKWARISNEGPGHPEETA